MTNLVAGKKQEVSSKKYSVREVLDSLSYEVVDHDGNYDGFVHVSSDINGMEIKISVESLRKQLGPLIEAKKLTDV